MEYDQKKGGEEMSLEGIKQVTEAETLAQQRRNEALAQAKKTVADARRAGEERFSSARIQAEAQVRGFCRRPKSAPPNTRSRCWRRPHGPATRSGRRLRAGWRMLRHSLSEGL